MTTHRSRHMFSIALAGGALCITAALAQNLGPEPFEMDWHTIDGGGGSSAGASFEVNGTIGQPDAGVILTGGDFEVRGGFWHGGVERVDTCPADIAPLPDGDSTIGVPDLLMLINTWGSCPGECPPTCPADVNDDCSVGVPDLLGIINAWGPCP